LKSSSSLSVNHEVCPLIVPSSLAKVIAQNVFSLDVPFVPSVNQVILKSASISSFNFN
jgi:hypothetical protein